MYEPIPTQMGCGAAWLAAAQRIATSKGGVYNVVVDVENPATLSGEDRRIVGLVDGFLRSHDSETRRVLPVASVANTIMPNALYLRYGYPNFFDVYKRDVYPKIKKSQEWGRYFYRMICHETRDGEINPLRRLVDKVRTQAQGARTYGNVFELPVTDPALDVNTYNPACDGNLLRGGPCLSFLSFKLHSARGLMLTAVYRNHYFIQRALGNYIGLGWLLAFVAREANVEVGPLTCISTHAEVDLGPWGKGDVDQLLADCDMAGRAADSRASEGGPGAPPPRERKGVELPQ